MNKLKNIDWKQFGINHGEKIGAAVIGLLVLLAISGSSWSAFDKTNDELVRSVEATEQAVNDPVANDWNKKTEEVQFFENVDDIHERARKMGKAVGFEKFQLTTQLTWPRVEPRSKRSAVALVPAEDLIVAFASDALRMKPEETETEKTDKSDDTADDDEDRPRFRGAGDRRSGGNTTGDTNFGSPASGSSGGAGAPAGGGAGAGAGAGAGSLGLSGDGLGGGNGAAGSGGAALTWRAQGQRMASLRAVVDVYRQKELIAKALHVPITHPSVEESLSYLDFQVQRQVMNNGEWSDWNDIDIRITSKIIRSTDGEDEEVVSREVTNDVMTIPLPRRLVELWGDDASHPRIENYKLSQSQKDRQAKKDKLIRELYEKAKKNRQRDNRPRKRGWSDGGPSLDQMEDEIKDEEEFKEFKKQYAEEQTARGSLLLFRYLDFSVKQGYSYRYRVRLELENPHYGVPLDELEDPALGERPTLLTAWSEPSGTISIPYDYEYYVDDVEDRPDRQLAEMEIFYWSIKTGTRTATEKPMKIRVGDFVGGETKSYVLKMDAQTLKKEEIVFESRDVLLDVDAPPQLDPTVLTDLKSEIEALDKQRPLGARITVVRPDGAVETRVSNPYAKSLASARRFMTGLMEEYGEKLGWREDSKKKKDEGDSNLAAPGAGPTGG